MTDTSNGPKSTMCQVGICVSCNPNVYEFQNEKGLTDYGASSLIWNQSQSYAEILTWNQYRCMCSFQETRSVIKEFSHGICRSNASCFVQTRNHFSSTEHYHHPILRTGLNCVLTMYMYFKIKFQELGEQEQPIVNSGYQYNCESRIVFKDLLKEPFCLTYKRLV